MSPMPKTVILPKPNGLPMRIKAAFDRDGALQLTVEIQDPYRPDDWVAPSQGIHLEPVQQAALVRFIAQRFLSEGRAKTANGSRRRTSTPSQLPSRPLGKASPRRTRRRSPAQSRASD